MIYLKFCETESQILEFWHSKSLFIDFDRLFVSEIFNFGGKDYVTLFKNKYDNYKLKANEYIALSKRSQSYDGRYVDEGVQNVSNIKGRYKLFYISKSDLGYCYELDSKKIANDKLCQLVNHY